MEWNMKDNPTFKDISANRSPYFLTVRRHSAFVAKDYYNSKLDKWFKNSDCVEEVPVAAWMPLPKFDYDLINDESELNNRKSSSLIDYFVDLIAKEDSISPHIVVQEFSPDFEVSTEIKDKVRDFTFKYI